MNYREALTQVRDLPLFRSSLLQVGDVNPVNLQKQLSRWTASGKIEQLRRGLYTLASPYRKIEPHPFLIANQLVEPSYVSLQSALAYYEMIPEAVFEVTNITSRRRTTIYETDFGAFSYQFIQKDLFTGYSLAEVAAGQWVYIARPEKALLDLIYLTPKGDQMDYLETLRLQNIEQLDLFWMESFVRECGVQKLIAAVENLSLLVQTEGRVPS
jgi:predicted transcriptional regulator of viral defense system